MSDSKITIGYWFGRGFVEHIRMVLHYGIIDYDLVTYTWDQDAEGNWSSKWLDVKPTLGHPFPNLPYLIEGDLMLSQSSAILRYVGQKAGLYGSSPKENAQIDMLLDNLSDRKPAYLKFVYMEPDIDQAKAGYLEGFSKYLASLESWISDRKWFAGENLSIADFALWSFIDFHECLDQRLLPPFPKLAEWKKRFTEVPKVSEYLGSTAFSKYPINTARAKWGVTP